MLALRVICGTAVASLMTVAALAQTAAPEAAPSAAPSTVRDAAPCAPDIERILRRYPIRGNIEETTAEGYGLAVFTLKSDAVSTTAWFRRPEKLWCLLGLGTDVVLPARGVALGVPEPIASKLVAQLAALGAKHQ